MDELEFKGAHLVNAEELVKLTPARLKIFLENAERVAAAPAHPKRADAERLIPLLVLELDARRPDKRGARRRPRASAAD